MAVFDKQDHIEGGSTFGRATKVDVPVGYEAYAATVMSDYIFTDGQDHDFHVMVGGTSFDRTPTWGASYQALAAGRRTSASPSSSGGRGLSR